MSTIKGNPSQEKEERSTSQHTTVEPVRLLQDALSVLAHMWIREISSAVVVEARSTDKVINATGHFAQRGDVITFTSGALSGQDVKVLSVETNTITMGEKTPSAPAAADTFDIKRHVYPRANAAGRIEVEYVAIDHGDLLGLADDDHLQYLNEARHDAIPADNPHSVTFTQAVAADPGTDITAAETETLTDGSDANALHTHGGLGTDEQVKVTANDTTTGYLFDKLTAGSTKISLTEVNDGGDEDLAVDVVEANIDHTAISNIGTNSHAAIDSHISSTANPHSVTAAQVGNTTAQWNANQLEGEDISTTAPTSGQVLTYNNGTSEWEPVTPASGAPTKEIFFPSDWGSNLGSYRVRNQGSSADFNHVFWVPHDFSSITALEIVGINQGVSTAAANIDLISEYGAVGEDSANHAETNLVFTVDFSSVAANETFSYDISSVFTSLAAGDYCGIEIDHSSLGGTLSYLGIRLRYS